MNRIENLIRTRRSVRTYEKQPITPSDFAALQASIQEANNPYGLMPEYVFLSAAEKKLRCPVVVGADLYACAKIKKAPHADEAFGFSFERFLLSARSLGIGTVWIGGTMDRPGFESAVSLAPDEMLPAVTPLGYPAQKMSVRESMMRKAIRADAREPFEKLFYSCVQSGPLTPETAGRLYMPLEMVRLAPSAVNRQPWRVFVTGDAAHFYLSRARIFTGQPDMQKMDMGIALCHFSLQAEADGIPLRFEIADPALAEAQGLEYIATYRY